MCGRASQDAHDNEVSAICFNAQGSYMATGGADKVVKVWSWREAQGVSYSTRAVKIHGLSFAQRNWNPSAV
jgi:WD40 repeat protein